VQWSGDAGAISRDRFKLGRTGDDAVTCHPRGNDNDWLNIAQSTLQDSVTSREISTLSDFDTGKDSGTAHNCGTHRYFSTSQDSMDSAIFLLLKDGFPMAKK
jgi:hypothetical protein